jgi:Kef-type K+ transport system membrane component KefB
MLWILLLAVYFALVRGGPLPEIAAATLFLAGIALLFAFVGNRRLIKDSLHYANFRNPGPTTRSPSSSRPTSKPSPG